MEDERAKTTEAQRGLTDREKADHARSVADYPDLDLGDNEYVVIDVQRTAFYKICWVILSGIAIVVVFALAVLMLQLTGDDYKTQIFSGALIVATIVALIAMAEIYVYDLSYFIVTNRRIISRTYKTLLSRTEQEIELWRIEDVNYSTAGVLQSLFNYGSIRASTASDEQTYLFPYATNAEEQCETVKKAVQEATPRDGSGQRSGIIKHKENR